MEASIKATEGMGFPRDQLLEELAKGDQSLLGKIETDVAWKEAA